MIVNEIRFLQFWVTSNKKQNDPAERKFRVRVRRSAKTDWLPGEDRLEFREDGWAVWEDIQMAAWKDSISWNDYWNLVEFICRKFSEFMEFR